MKTIRSGKFNMGHDHTLGNLPLNDEHITFKSKIFAKIRN